jgi:hypothetical protein
MIINSFKCSDTMDFESGVAETLAHHKEQVTVKLFVRKDGRRYPVRSVTATLTNEDTEQAELELEFVGEVLL